MKVLVTRIFAAVAIIYVSICGVAMAQDPVKDPFCLKTNEPSLRLAAAVARSPHHATKEIGEAVDAVLTAYLDCAKAYKRDGNADMYIYAIATGADLFLFSARNSDALGDRATARDVLLSGERTLSHALTVVGGRPEYRTGIRNQRNEIAALLRKIGR